MGELHPKAFPSALRSTIYWAYYYKLMLRTLPLKRHFCYQRWLRNISYKYTNLIDVSSVIASTASHLTITSQQAHSASACGPVHPACTHRWRTACHPRLWRRWNASPRLGNHQLTQPAGLGRPAAPPRHASATPDDGRAVAIAPRPCTSLGRHRRRPLPAFTASAG